MNKPLVILLLFTSFLSCKNAPKHSHIKFVAEDFPTNIPLEFKSDIIPDHKLIHKGIFSPDLEEYYYTLSDTNFEHFDVYVIKQRKGKWSEPEKAFFNSTYKEHGMSFSPNGNTLYFSSTRPVNREGIPPTWHIWKSEKVHGQWTEPSFIDIPNLRDKLLSHPIMTNTGTLYFHTSNLDYSEMDINSSKLIQGTYENAKKVAIPTLLNIGKCTPYVSPKEEYLIFTSISDDLSLMIVYPDGKGGWMNARKLNNKINHQGQGNPYVTPDNRFLFFTTGDPLGKNWKVKWVNIEAELSVD